MKQVQRAWRTVKSSSTFHRLIRKPQRQKKTPPTTETSDSMTPMLAGPTPPTPGPEIHEGDVHGEEDCPTIRQAIRQYAEQFLEACEGNILGNISSTIIRFSKQPNLPPYYQIKCYIILAAAREEDTPEENVAAGKHYIAKAREALVRGRELYVHDPRDAITLQALRKCVDEEWAALRAYEKNVLYKPEDEDENWPLKS